MNRATITRCLFTLSIFGLGVAVGSVGVRPAVSRLASAQAETLQPNPDALMAQTGRSCPSFGDFVEEYVDPDTGETGEKLLIKTTEGRMNTADLLARYYYGYCLRRGYVK